MVEKDDEEDGEKVVTTNLTEEEVLVTNKTKVTITPLKLMTCRKFNSTIVKSFYYTTECKNPHQEWNHRANLTKDQNDLEPACSPS